VLHPYSVGLRFWGSKLDRVREPLTHSFHPLFLFGSSLLNLARRSWECSKLSHGVFVKFDRQNGCGAFWAKKRAFRMIAIILKFSVRQVANL